LGRRYYDPVLGRFLQPDPIVPDAANPHSLNLYSYVLNNALNLVDPTGLFDEKPRPWRSESTKRVSGELGRFTAWVTDGQRIEFPNCFQEPARNYMVSVGQSLTFGWSASWARIPPPRPFHSANIV